MKCDKCKKDFIIDIKTEMLKDNIERVYFCCPHCKAEHTAYYTDILIKKKQQQMKELQRKYSEAAKAKDIKRSEKIFKQIRKLQKEIKKAMENLRKRVGSEINKTLDSEVDK